MSVYSHWWLDEPSLNQSNSYSNILSKELTAYSSRPSVWTLFTHTHAHFYNCDTDWFACFLFSFRNVDPHKVVWFTLSEPHFNKSVVVYTVQGLCRRFGSLYCPLVHYCASQLFINPHKHPISGAELLYIIINTYTPSANNRCQILSTITESWLEELYRILNNWTCPTYATWYSPLLCTFIVY